MVNKVILNYLKVNYGKYKVSDMKEKILEGGYTKEEFDSTLELFLNSRKGKKALKKEQKQVLKEEIKGSSKKATKKLSRKGGKNDSEKVVEVNDLSKPSIFIMVGFISGIFMTFLSVLFSVGMIFPAFVASLSFYLIAFLMVLAFFSFIFYYVGFFSVGRRFKGKLVSLSSIFLIVIFCLFVITSIVLVVYTGVYVASAMESVSVNPAAFLSGPQAMKVEISNIISTQINNFPSIGKALIVNSCILVMLLFVVYFLFSLGLILVHKKVKMSLFVGIVRMIFSLSLMFICFALFYAMFKIIFNPEIVVDAVLIAKENSQLLIETLLGSGFVSYAILSLLLKISFVYSIICFIVETVFLFLVYEGKLVK